ncbi:MAG TPA: two-component regulator propeller domain-containing protein, partial [Thermoanaerobaculia bacterium]|nr:two-component regulator propeller domain-containing protein [Thermoanaerobaculia bacterium]
ALPYFDPQAEYVWDLAFDRSSLYVATGVPGRIFRVTAPAEGRLFDDAGDEHVRCLYVDPQGRLWAGTSGRGLVLRISPDGTARTIYDSEKVEIASIAGGSKGRVWAAAVSTKSGGGPPGGRPAPPPPPKEKKPEPSSSGGGDGEATVTVTTSASLVPPVPSSPGGKGNESSEVLEIDPDDSVSTAWRSDDELVHSCRWDAAADGLLVATGPRGRVYLVRDGQASLSASVDEKRVVFASDDVLATDSPASAYRRVPAREGEFFSAIKDTGRTSRFGAYRTDAAVPKGTALTLEFRSGNSGTPDATWSPWSPPLPAATPGKIAAPPGRFLQWKASFSASGEHAPLLSRVECAYQNENARPNVESVAVGVPGREGPPTFAAASSDDPGAESIFGSADEKGSSRAEARGLLTVTWKASDPDGDELVADGDFRPASGDAPGVAMRRGVRGNSFGFDSRLLPDGRYLFRVTVSDRPGNPEDPRSESMVSDPVVVDNTPPVISLVSATAAKSGPVLRVRVVDALSPIAAVGWSVSAGPWVRAAADDGMTDSPEESYTISLQPESRGAYVLVRAVDAAGNTSSLSIVAP